MIWRDFLLFFGVDWGWAGRHDDGKLRGLTLGLNFLRGGGNIMVMLGYFSIVMAYYCEK